ncbi:hypothetical protein PILCRDRAFT_82347 [Piloderma croceum F 1598]|uniref:Uncharacterized protein n=1 Tax=Piloderma croceum (strain F 1598) TaxID=765440 RepID=A0A0C3B3P6_PILCF|nr:hypothetical protein PILCRDRAFT_82347 [Piloderma croceum F 1598]
MASPSISQIPNSAQSRSHFRPPPHNYALPAAASSLDLQVEPALAPIDDSNYHLHKDGVYMCAACLYLISCVSVACWMLVSGPKLVPRQDTRITNAIISLASKVALGLALWIVTMRLRAQWVQVLISGQHVGLRGLLAACGGEGSLLRVCHIRNVPTVGVGCTAVIGAAVTLLMTLTSAGFKYIVISGTAVQEFSGPDFQAICNYSLVNSSNGYFCTGSANAVTVETEWNLLDIVNSGAGGNVLLSGGDTGTMSANVTLTTAPADLRLATDPAPPWAAIDVSCRDVELQLQLVGNGSTSSNLVHVDGRLLDQLTIAEMPSWASQVQLYQQVNDSGPASSLCPWYMVLLARDLNDGTANIGGLSGGAVSFLGNSFVDLHGYGPTLQGILGAAAYCNFSGSTGGDWPSDLWPARATTNVVVGTAPTDGTVDISTVFLNYGPSWQYSPVSANSLPGGSVTYIANWTVPADNFADFIAMYMRNQWALMMYTNNYIGGYVANTPYNVKTQPQLHIQATVIVLLPVVALSVCVCCAGVFLWAMLGLGVWYENIDVAPWWLLKATGATWAGLEGHNMKKPEFDMWCKQMQCMYSIEASDPGAGYLTLESTTT